MNKDYFSDLNKMLKSYDRSLPMALLDLDILDQNIVRLKAILSKEVHFRIVVKSLPFPQLVDYIQKRMGTNRLMVFHQPFLSQIADSGNDQLDILMGKPMPVNTVNYFYNHFKGSNGFDPFKQVQWLVDTKERIVELINLAKNLGRPLRLNLELDIGLHRGGFSNLAELRKSLQLFRNSRYVVFSGFMGYDPHVVKLPKIIKSAPTAFREANDQYGRCIQLLKSEFPNLYSDNLTFNGGGSPSLEMHQDNTSAINDIAAGSALLKPTSFDIPSLDSFQPACFIATPILKKIEGVVIPGIEKLSGLMKLFNKTNQNTYFIYGGYWKADYCYPVDAKENQLFGSSTNQSMVNSSEKLEVDDFIFLRPRQSEAVLLQFGNLKVISKRRVVEEWPVFRND